MLPSFARITLPCFLITLAGAWPLLAADDVASPSLRFPADSLPLNQIGAKTSVDYHGDAMGIEKTADGAKLHTAFQKLAGTVTRGGLWLESTSEKSGRLRVVADRVGREGVKISSSNAQIPRKDQGSNIKGNTATALWNLEFDPSLSVEHWDLDFKGTPLDLAGHVSVGKDSVTFARPGLAEEYSVSVDGVRQDFVVTQRPTGLGELCVELALDGGHAEAAYYGAKVTLDGSGRVLAYSRLKAMDAKGRELAATMQVTSEHRLQVCVDDAGAAYPVRIDPTFSDANWVSLNPGIPGANAAVTAMARDSSGNLYFAGTFTFIGTVSANHVAKWDGSHWSALGSGITSSTPTISALAVDGSGHLYAGGLFTVAGGNSVSNIAVWDGVNWADMGGGTNNIVSALAVDSSGNLYAGGSFITAGGNTVNDLAKWNGSLWSAVGGGMNGAVDALTFDSSGNLYVGGAFTTAGGTTTVNRIAKWDGALWSALSTGITGTGAFVSALALDSSGNLYAGGIFTTAGGNPVSDIAVWNGTLWSPLTSGTNGKVSAMVVDGSGNLYVGGSFSSAGGTTGAGSIAKWNSINGWSFLGTGMNSTVSALVLDSVGNLYAGGAFTTANGGGASFLAVWNGAWSAAGSGMNNNVSALAVDGSGNLYAGGSFTTAGGNTVNDIAEWNGTAWSALGSGMNGAVTALTCDSSGNLYAGGSFTTAVGVTVNHVAEWNGTAWLPLSVAGNAGVNGNVTALAVDNSSGTLYAGGAFTAAGGTPASHIAAWNGSSWSPLSSGVTGGSLSVNGLAVDGSGNLYAGGSFTNAGGVTVANIAKWSGGAWSALSAGVNNTVNAVACDSSGNLYAGGFFTTATSGTTVTVNRVAKWNGSAWSALGTGVNAQVTALAVDGFGNLFAGGTFTNASGNNVNNVAYWNGTTWAAIGSGVNAGVLAIATDKTRQRVYIGGSFTFAGTTVSPFVVEAPFTEGPTLSTPANNASIGNPVSVTFTLPEAALPGTVQLSFGANVLTLASSQEIAGTHIFSFNAANPIASPQIASGNPIPDGTYTVTLSYQYALGNPVATTSSTNVALDTTTLPPTLTSPASNTSTPGPVNVFFTLPEAALLGSVQLSFGSNVLVLGGSQSAGAHSLAFDPANPTGNPQIAIGSPIPDGTYTVTLSYQDVVGNPVASAISTNVTIDTTTQTPTLIAPSSNSVINSPISVAFTLPEAATPGSVQLSFGPNVFTLASSQETAGGHSFTFDSSNPTASPQILSGTAFANATYTVTLSYQDVFGNPVVSTSSTNVTLGATTITQAPTLTVPANNAIVDNPVSVAFTLPQAALPGSLKLSFGSNVLVLASSQETAGAHSFSFNPAHPTGTLEVLNGTPIPDGVYSVTLSYQNTASDPAASAAAANVTLDTTSQTPTLTAPATNAVASTAVSVSFSLPETAAPGSVQLSFGTHVLTLASSQETTGVHSFTFNPANPTASAQIASGSAIPDGNYTVTLSYQDTLNNAAATASSTNVTIDNTTQTPTLIAPATNAATSNPASVSFSLPEAAASGTLKLSFGTHVLTLASSQTTAGVHSFTFDPANPIASPQITNGVAIPNGNYTVTLSYQDALNNPLASTSSTNVTLANNNANLSTLSLSSVTLSPVFAKGTPGYSSTVHFVTSSTAVTPTAEDSHASIKVNTVSVPTGTASGAINLNVGGTTITVVVTAEDGTTQQTYTVNVTRQSNVQDWRQRYFGSTSNSGNAADTANPAHDGIPNLIKFATGLDPTVAESQPGTITDMGGDVEFTYPRSDAAMADGLTFTVQWSNTLPGTSWSNAGVTEQILSDDGTTQLVKASVPPGGAGFHFVHLMVTSP